MKRAIRRLSAILLLLAAVAPLLAEELPGASIYRLPASLVDQNGHAFVFADRRGKPQLVSMFYTSCQYVCPLIIDTMQKTQRALNNDERARLQIILLSFDPERDTPARLKEVFVERKLDTQTWTFAQPKAGDVRRLAAVLDIQYRALANRDINHSSALVLLDGEGRIVARTDKIGELDPEFVAKLKNALARK